MRHVKLTPATPTNAAAHQSLAARYAGGLSSGSAPSRLNPQASMSEGSRTHKI
jgi:hypothetical protein